MLDTSDSDGTQLDHYHSTVAARTAAAKLEGRVRGVPDALDEEMVRSDQHVKLGERQSGPYRVVKVHDGMTAELVNVDDPDDTMTRNVEHLVACRGGLTESQRRQEWEVESVLAERGKAPRIQVVSKLATLPGLWARPRQVGAA